VEFDLSRRAALAGAGLGLAALPLQPLLARAAAQHFPAIEGLLAELVDGGKLPGLVATVGFGAAPPRIIARGKLAFGDAPVMSGDTLFRIYSMTKLVTGMAAMTLIERGKLKLDQPIADFLPKFAKMQVLLDPNGPLDRVRPASNPITVRQLMTHSAGLGYAIVQTGPIHRAYLDAGLGAGLISHNPPPGLAGAPPAPGLAAFADRLAELPLVYEPGTQWSYSVGLDLLGRVIELAAGMPFDRFVQQTILDPCAMHDTRFHALPADAARLATNYAVGKDRIDPLDPGASSIYLDPLPAPYGGSGLLSTPRDYDRFLTMLAGGGIYRGRRVLPARAVYHGGSNLLLPSVNIKGTWVEHGGQGAGAQVGVGDQAGVIGWSGAAGTVFRLDLRRGTRIAIYSQHMPTSAYELYDRFPKAAASDLKAPRLVI